MNIVFLDTLTLGNVPNLHILKRFGEIDFYETTSASEVVDRCRGKEIVITNKVIFDKARLSLLPELKLICLTATGMNNVDLDYARERNIVVKNVAGYSTESVAQTTFAMLLYLLNHLRFYDDYVRSGEFSKSSIFTHIGEGFWQLKGKQFGIIGLGTIGKRVALIAQSFGCKVVYYSTSGKNNNSSYQRLSLEELLKTSEVVSIHAPLNKNTLGLLSYDYLKLMKPSAILINVGRGGIVNENDLAKALDAEIIAGAALDVLHQEPVAAENPLLKIKNKDKLLITPHIAWASVEARTLLVEKVAENIRIFMSGIAG
ncbi:MAG: D-2-hydroxyacid dehydrogenase [Bacteroidota bacterium]|nr:D-2-hydroxyacid dehydrogenase [Bacteroidota bacterium]MDP4226287.1 D-2-hydroxyacid dehydrogenase [Bacteroidota bacterium]MDP4273364.1 D-2-hydroxyacid dehydrogenase [Bacteroidota bacterium]